MVNNIHNPGIQMQLKYHARYTLAEVLLLAACISPPGKPATMQALPECGWLPNCVNSESGRGAQASNPQKPAQ